jgi:S1-C subfamily serine protease
MNIEKGIVQVFSDKTLVDYSHPWTFTHRERSTGSGFAVELEGFKKPTKYIITNAHCVNDSTYTTVRKQGISRTFKAVIEAIGYEVDLAILSVEDSQFWEDVTILRIGKMPHKLSNVHVYGFPLGGHNISITQGVVNRIRIIPYFNTTKGVTIQIDAPINFGNSGGPALDDSGAVVGVAFAGEDDARTQNMGYLIPGIIIEFFFSMIQKYKTFKGICDLGISFQKMHNATLREYYELPPSIGGVLITHINENSSLKQLVEPGDIITKLNGIPVDTDGTIAMRDVLMKRQKVDLIPLVSEERISFTNLISLHLPDEEAIMTIWNNGKTKDVHFKTRLRDFLVPLLPYQASPSYFIVSGLVFVPLTYMMIERLLESDEYDLSHMLMYAEEEKTFPDHQKIVLTEILLSEMTDGFNNKMDILYAINDIEIKNLRHMFTVVNEQTKKKPYIMITFENSPDVIVLKSSEVRKYSRSIAIDQIGVSDIYYNDDDQTSTSKVVKAAKHRELQRSMKVQELMDEDALAPESKIENPNKTKNKTPKLKQASKKQENP